MSKPQPYTKADLAKGEQVVRELHGISGFEGWAEHIAKAIAAERERVLAEPDKVVTLPVVRVERY